MRIGVISDTHGFLDEKVFKYFKDCDEIWHAGDIGNMAVAEKLGNFKPLKAVYGNIDTPQIRRQFPEEFLFEIDGLKILMRHIGGKPPRYAQGIKRKLTTLKPDIFICGHSHILRIMRDPDLEDLLYINPGAAGREGIHKIRTLVQFEIDSGSIRNLQVIELGKRSAIL